MNKLKRISIGVCALTVTTVPVISSISFASSQTNSNTAEFNLLKSEFENIQTLKDKMEPQYDAIASLAKDSSSYSAFVN